MWLTTFVYIFLTILCCPDTSLPDSHAASSARTDNRDVTHEGKSKTSVSPRPKLYLVQWYLPIPTTKFPPWNQPQVHILSCFWVKFMPPKNVGGFGVWKPRVHHIFMLKTLIFAGFFWSPFPPLLTKQGLHPNWQLLSFSLLVGFQMAPMDIW